MSQSVKFLSNNLVRWAAGWMARSLAVASVFLLGRSGEAVAQPMESANEHSPAYTLGHGTEVQVSYVQIGHKDGGDWPPPVPE